MGIVFPYVPHLLSTAIWHRRKEQIDITQEPKLTPEQAELFLRSRRSIRNYQNKPVPAELIRKVLNVARMAPTATIHKVFRIS